MNKTIRNVIIFIFVTLSCGWIGLIIDKIMIPQPNKESLGMGIWIALPLITTLLLRLFAGDGWKDIGLKLNFKGNVKWYILSIIIFPLITGAILIFGQICGWVNTSNFRINDYFSVFIGLLLYNLVKNIFEESVWRGYLTAKLLKLKIKDIWLYIIVGGVWGLHHLPYYLFFLPHSTMYEILPVGRLLFAIVSFVTLIFWSVMFIELYRLTESIWPAVLLHMVEDSMINHLIIDGHIIIASGKEIWISPVVGLITSLLYVGVGLVLRHYRIKKYSEKAMEAK
jgi:hypothetical protein